MTSTISKGEMPEVALKAAKVADEMNRALARALKAMPDVKFDNYGSGLPTTCGNRLFSLHEVAQALEDGLLPWAVTAAALDVLGGRES